MSPGRGDGPFLPALQAVEGLIRAGGPPVLVAVDGRCGSGKTGLGALLGRTFSCAVFHMDDFYLPAERRMPDWAADPGGNMDLARFRREVLLPAKAGKSVLYRPYGCREDRLLPPVSVPPAPLAVVEGSYSQHPALADLYDLRIFLTCSREEQARRLRAREGERFRAFEARWIPMEERYFRVCGLPGDGALVLDTTDLFA